MMLPIMLNICGRKCTVIGGGKTAFRKAKKLKEYGGSVTMVASEFYGNTDGITTIKKCYDKNDVKNSFLVIAATNDKNLNRQIGADAKSFNILVSLADDAETSDFVFPAAKKAGNITLSVSTNGGFPMLSRKLCNEKAADLEFYNSILPILEKYRKQIISKNESIKKELLEYMISDEMISVAKTDTTLFEQKIKEKL